MRRVCTLLLVVITAFGLGACGDDGDDNEAGGNGNGAAAGEVEVSGEAGAKPTMEIPDGDPPAELQIKDITVGEGAEAAVGKTVTVHYAGNSWSTKEQFDASWDGGEPVSFPLVEGGLIDGWIQGVPGMKIGGRRLLVIPPELGYGPAGREPIKPNETLVFVIDLVAVA